MASLCVVNEPTYVLTLDKYEAAVLREILSNTGGDPSTSPRKLTTQVLSVMGEVPYIYSDFCVSSGFVFKANTLQGFMKAVDVALAGVKDDDADV